MDTLDSLCAGMEWGCDVYRWTNGWMDLIGHEEVQRNNAASTCKLFFVNSSAEFLLLLLLLLACLIVIMHVAERRQNNNSDEQVRLQSREASKPSLFSW